MVGFALYGGRSAPLAFGLYHALCLVGWRTLRGDPTAARRSLPAWVAAASALGAAAATWVLWTWAGSVVLDPPRLRAALESLGVGRAAFVWLFPYFLLVNPVLEELFWRDGVLPALRRAGWGAARAEAVSSLLFGLWHMLPVALLLRPWVAILSVVGIVVVGGGLARLREAGFRRRDLALMHAVAADAPLLLALWLAWG